MTRRPPDCPTCGKQSFGKRQHAEREASLRSKSMPGQRPLRVYACWFCGCWHLTGKAKIRRART